MEQGRVVFPCETRLRSDDALSNGPASLVLAEDEQLQQQSGAGQRRHHCRSSGVSGIQKRKALALVLVLRDVVEETLKWRREEEDLFFTCGSNNAQALPVDPCAVETFFKYLFISWSLKRSISLGDNLSDVCASRQSCLSVRM